MRRIMALLLSYLLLGIGLVVFTTVSDWQPAWLGLLVGIILISIPTSFVLAVAFCIGLLALAAHFIESGVEELAGAEADDNELGGILLDFGMPGQLAASA